MTTDRDDLEPLLAPESVAVVGASPDSWYSSQLVENLLAYGHDGPLYLVNPSREQAWGRPCYDELRDVPEVVDLVVVSVPREYVVGVVEQADAAGVPAALVITAGFGEADDEGATIEAKLERVVDEGGIRLCGPNCIGLANTHDGKVLTSTCSRQPAEGSVGLVSHSGALAFTTFFERGEDESTGFAYVVSTGNEVDQTLTDYVEYMGADDRVDIIATYVEGVEDPRRFMRVADDVVRDGTPIVSIKVGQSESADTATVSHTGSLTGNDDAWNAAFAQTGVQRVEDIPDILSLADVHTAYDPHPAENVCIASTSGGLASLLADLADVHGLDLPPLADATEQSLLDFEGLMTFDAVPNPADIRGYGADHLPTIAETLFADDTFDAYVFAIGLSAVDDRAEDIADDLITVAEMATDPVVFLWTGRKEPTDDGTQPYERLRAEVPLYYDPKRCIEALASLDQFRDARQRLQAQHPRRALEAEIDTTTGEDLPSGETLSWARATELLERDGISVEHGAVTTTPAETAQVATDLGFPVVVKVDSPGVPHRNHIGAVLTDIDDGKGARAAHEEIYSRVQSARPDAEIHGTIVQPQIAAGVEVLVGVSRDRDFGPLVTVGSGGTAVETLDDSTILVPPFTAADAEAALDRTHVQALLEERGYAAQRGELASLLVTVGNLAVRNETLAELDLNPVIVTDDGCHVIDVLARTESAKTEE